MEIQKKNIFKFKYTVPCFDINMHTECAHIMNINDHTNIHILKLSQ